MNFWKKGTMEMETAVGKMSRKDSERSGHGSGNNGNDQNGTFG